MNHIRILAYEKGPEGCTRLAFRFESGASPEVTPAPFLAIATTTGDEWVVLGPVVRKSANDWRANARPVYRAHSLVVSSVMRVSECKTTVSVQGQHYPPSPGSVVRLGGMMNEGMYIVQAAFSFPEVLEIDIFVPAIEVRVAPSAAGLRNYGVGLRAGREPASDVRDIGEEISGAERAFSELDEAFIKLDKTLNKTIDAMEKRVEALKAHKAKLSKNR